MKDNSNFIDDETLISNDSQKSKSSTFDDNVSKINTDSTDGYNNWKSKWENKKENDFDESLNDASFVLKNKKMINENNNKNINKKVKDESKISDSSVLNTKNNDNEFLSENRNDLEKKSIKKDTNEKDKFNSDSNNKKENDKNPQTVDAQSGSNSDRDYKREQLIHKISKLTSIILMLVVFPILMISIGISGVSKRNGFTESVVVQDVITATTVGTLPDLSSTSQGYDVYENLYPDFDIPLIDETLPESETNPPKYEWVLYGIDFGVDGITWLDGENYQFLIIEVYNGDTNLLTFSSSTESYTIESSRLPSEFYKDLNPDVWVIVLGTLFGVAILTSFFGWFWFSKYREIKEKE